MSQPVAQVCLIVKSEARLLASLILISILALSVRANATDIQTGRSCFERLGRNSSPFEVYVGAGKDRMTYVQPVGPSFGLSDTAKAFLDGPASLATIQLCDGNFVGVWLRESFGKWPDYLWGRLFDGEGRSLTDDFRIDERDEPQWEHGVARLYDGRFVVVWKTSKGNDIGIRADLQAIRHADLEVIHGLGPWRNEGISDRFGTAQGRICRFVDNRVPV